MKWAPEVLRTRVGRRMLALFVLCSLVPIALLGLLSYWQVTRQLDEQGRQRLRHGAKHVAMEILERIQSLETQAALLAADWSKHSGHAGRLDSAVFSQGSFTGAALESRAGAVIAPLGGEIAQLPPLTDEARAHLAAGRTVLATVGSWPRTVVFLGTAVHAHGRNDGVLWLQVDTSYLWRAVSGDGLAFGSEVCVLAADLRPIACTAPGTVENLGPLEPSLLSANAGELEWEAEGGTHLGAYWSLFLRYHYLTPQWKVVVGQSRASVLAPVKDFTHSFPLALLVALWSVLLLGNAEIRKLVHPLLDLREGTRRIARRDFDVPVSVRSGDEFEDLAHSFNEMAHEVKARFEEGERLNAALREAAEAVRRSELRARATLETAADAIVTADEVGRIESFNRTAEQMFGYSREEIIGREVRALLQGPESEAGRIEWSSLRAVRSWSEAPELYGLRSDRSTFPVEIAVSEAVFEERPLVIVALRDITSRRDAEKERGRLEAQLRQAQKMETIGTLAGGIAHDFNNILTPILGYIELMMSEVPPDHPLRHPLGEVKTASERARELVRQILVFSRRAEHRRARIRIEPIVREAVGLLRATLPSTIEIRKEIAGDCPPAMADGTEVHQVVMNLCTNAYHAMRDSGGILTVRLDSVRVDASHVRALPSLREGVYVRLTVRDTGHGMDQATMTRLFEPFFTTKGPGEGTGLGLSVVHGIVTGHGGAVSVESALGEGTTFVIHLPAAEGDVAEPAEEGDGTAEGNEHVLFVDDEPQIRSVIERALERMGYRVTAASDAQEALALVRMTPEPFDVMLTDHAMPGMTGLELARELSAIRPDLPVILVTGYHDDSAGASSRDVPCVRARLTKPVELRELGRTIQRVLGREAHGAVAPSLSVT